MREIKKLKNKIEQAKKSGSKKISLGLFEAERLLTEISQSKDEPKLAAPPVEEKQANVKMDLDGGNF